jgi:hypothetical protein
LTAGQIASWQVAAEPGGHCGAGGLLQLPPEPGPGGRESFASERERERERDREREIVLHPFYTRFCNRIALHPFCTHLHPFCIHFAPVSHRSCTSDCYKHYRNQALEREKERKREKKREREGERERAREREWMGRWIPSWRPSSSSSSKRFDHPPCGQTAFDQWSNRILVKPHWTSGRPADQRFAHPRDSPKLISSCGQTAYLTSGQTAVKRSNRTLDQRFAHPRDLTHG